MKIQKYLLPIFIGCLVGAFTLAGQKILPVNLNFLANSASMWLIPTFLIPFYLKTDKKVSIVLSVISLISSVLGYYIIEAIVNHHEFVFSIYIFLWLGCAFVGGSVFGLGANFANTKDNILRCLGMNLLPAFFISEGLGKVVHYSEYKHMIIGVLLSVLIGVVLYFIINSEESLKKKNLLSIICLVALGTAGFSVLSAI